MLCTCENATTLPGSGSVAVAFTNAGKLKLGHTYVMTSIVSDGCDYSFMPNINAGLAKPLLALGHG